MSRRSSAQAWVVDTLLAGTGYEVLHPESRHFLAEIGYGPVDFNRREVGGDCALVLHSFQHVDTISISCKRGERRGLEAPTWASHSRRKSC
jgi:hypothetical protein